MLSGWAARCFSQAGETLLGHPSPPTPLQGTAVPAKGWASLPPHGSSFLQWSPPPVIRKSRTRKSGWAGLIPAPSRLDPHWVGSRQGPLPLGLWSQNASLSLFCDFRSHRMGRQGTSGDSGAQLLGKGVLVLSWGLDVVGVWAR